MRINYTYIIVIFTIVLFGCKKENKNPPTIDFGHFELLNTTIQQFPYNDSITEFIYTDSLNNEYIASTIPIFNHFGTSGHLTKYKDSDDYFFLTYQTEKREIRLSIPSLNKQFSIETEVKVDASDYESIRMADVVFIYYLDKFSDFNNGVFIAANERTRQGDFPDYDTPIPILIIHGEIFNNVYSNDNGNDTNTIIYFNFKKGVVGFKDKTTGMSYKLK
jgi:hypothetical protein